MIINHCICEIYLELHIAVLLGDFAELMTFAEWVCTLWICNVHTNKQTEYGEIHRNMYINILTGMMKSIMYPIS